MYTTWAAVFGVKKKKTIFSETDMTLTIGVSATILIRRSSGYKRYLLMLFAVFYSQL